MQVELPDAASTADPVRIQPGRSATVALCASTACPDRVRFVVRSLGEPATVEVGTSTCGTLHVGATIE